MKVKIKKIISGILAASMVVSILAPAGKTYAADEREIKFDMGGGPPIVFEKIGGGFASVEDNRLVGEKGKAIIQTGPMLESPPAPPGVRLYSTFKIDPNPDLPTGDDRPLLPVPGDVWAGYTFKGWKDKNGDPVTRLPYAIPYEDTTYFAQWEGNPSDYFEFRVKHIAQLNKVGGGIEPWNIYQTVDPNVLVDQEVDTSYGRDIPGYTYLVGSADPVNRRNYGETAQNASGAVIGRFNSVNKAYRGNMPNENLTVTYEYKPNPDIKFNFRVEHVTTNGTALADPVTVKKVAGAPIDASPKTDVSQYYTVSSMDVVKGKNMDLTNRLYGTDKVGGAFGTGDVFNGYMPNQDVTIRYTYAINPNARTLVSIEYVEQSQDGISPDIPLNSLLPSGTATTYNWVPGTQLTIPVPILQGYKDTWTAEWTNGVLGTSDMTLNTLKLDIGLTEVKVKIIYTGDYTDSNLWARVVYTSGEYGSIPGNSSPKSFLKGTHTLEDLLGDIVPTPDDVNLYMFDGWYKTNSLGYAVGNPMQELDTINLDSDVTLKAVFKEDPNSWVNIRFRTGTNGTISTVPSVQHIPVGTHWSDTAKIDIPIATGTGAYGFDGWYDSYGIKVDPVLDPALIEDMIYTARFILPGTIPGPEVLNTPDAHGRIGSDGRGIIEVRNAEDIKYYALTNESGTVIEVISGFDILIAGKTFEGLNPGAVYEVYELSSTVGTVLAGSGIASIQSSLKSTPKRVELEALGENVIVEPDGNNQGRAQIVVHPTAPDTVYALLDSNGNVVQQQGSPDGWLTPDSTNTVIFEDLDPDTTYTVVAKHVGETDTPEDREGSGSEVSTQLQYSIITVNGTILKVGSAQFGSPVTLYEEAERGDEVKITADLVNGAQKPFKRWKILSGSIPGFIDTRRNQTFTMPGENVTLLAEYGTATATPSDAEVTYEYTGTGQIAVWNLDELRGILTTPADLVLLGANSEVSYKIKLTKRNAENSEEDQIKAQSLGYEEAVNALWALDVEISRYVDGVEDTGYVLLNPNSAQIKLFIQLNIRERNHLDYKMWEKGSYISRDITPNASGSYWFDAEIYETYLLSHVTYRETMIRDSIGGDYSFVIPHGKTLDSSLDFQNWIPTADVPGNGIVWSYVGLSTNAQVYTAYDSSQPITENLVLYAYYRSSDPAWQNARDELEALIREAESLCNGGTLSQQKQNELQDAINNAKNLLNRSPLPSTNELIEEKNTLQKAINKAKETGGSQGGSGSGGGGGSTKTRSSLTPGVDGNWKLVNTENHQWVFELKDGSHVSEKWANLNYTHQGKTGSHWYHFNKDGIMDSGWFQEGGNWYYLSPKHDGWFGSMQTGWQYGSDDQKWYYLDPVSGAMAKGWKEINGKWYYFTESNQKNTYGYDSQKNQWVYLNVSERPLGSLYTNDRTPDGHQVNADGVWTEAK